MERSSPSSWPTTAAARSRSSFPLGLFDAHKDFFVHEVRGWLASRFALDLPAERTAVWGASLGAEFALAMGMRHPDSYGVVLAASPGGGYRPPDEMPDRLPRAYLVAGRQEPFFLENAKRWAHALQQPGTDAILCERDGEHGGEFWFEEIPRMLTWLLGN